MQVDGGRACGVRAGESPMLGQRQRHDGATMVSFSPRRQITRALSPATPGVLSYIPGSFCPFSAVKIKIEKEKVKKLKYPSLAARPSSHEINRRSGTTFSLFSLLSFLLLFHLSSNSTGVIIICLRHLSDLSPAKSRRTPEHTDGDSSTAANFDISLSLSLRYKLPLSVSLLNMHYFAEKVQIWFFLYEFVDLLMLDA